MATKADHRAMREVNRSIVLDLIRGQGPLSRTDLAKRTQLAKPTVSDIVDGLLTEGLLREVGTGTTTPHGGRPPSLLAYNEAATAYIGVDFGVHTTNVAVADGLGQIISVTSEPSIHGSVKRSVAQARKLARRGLAEAAVDESRVAAVGVAVPGTVDRESGACMLAPNIDWHDAPVRDLVADAFERVVTVHNVTHAAAIAEGTLGAARGVSQFVWVYVGTGVGAGIVVDRQLFYGGRGFAGELGHCPVADDGPLCKCGRRGCLETRASGPALVRAYHARIDGAAATYDAMEVVRRALAGERAAVDSVSEVGEWLGRGIASVLDILNPRLVVVGGPLVEAGALLLAPTRSSLATHALDAAYVDVVETELGARAELMGAVLLAVEIGEPSHRIVTNGFRPSPHPEIS